jgi:acyl-homoserine lactone synthase
MRHELQTWSQEGRTVFLITRENRQTYRAELDQIFRMRCDVFAKAMRWQGLYLTGGYEKDWLDNEEALYLGVYDETGAVAGSMRLNPTTSPTLTSRVFSRLVQFVDYPSSPTVFDITRFFVSKDARTSMRGLFYSCDLMCGSHELGLSNGWTEFTGVLGTGFLSSLVQLGIEVNALGLPTPIEGEDYVAVSVPICPDSLRRLYHVSKNFEPRLISVDLDAVNEAIPENRALVCS